MSIASRNCCLATIRYSAIASRKRKSGSRKFTPLKSKVCASSSTRKHPTSKLSLLRRKLLQHLRNLILRLYRNKHSHRPSTDNWIMRISQKKYTVLVILFSGIIFCCCLFSKVLGRPNKKRRTNYSSQTLCAYKKTMSVKSRKKMKKSRN